MVKEGMIKTSSGGGEGGVKDFFNQWIYITQAWKVSESQHEGGFWVEIKVKNVLVKGISCGAIHRQKKACYTEKK